MGGIVRGWVCLALLAASSACRQPNPEWLGPAGDEPTPGTSTSGTSTSGEGESSGSSSDDGVDPTGGPTGGTTGPDPSQCAPEPILGQGECPASCSSCDGRRCLMDCGVLDCQNATIVCPVGWPCDIVCTTDAACKRADLACPLDRDCTLDCQAFEACQNATLSCGVGTCAVTCGADINACRSLDVACGPADATVTCAAPSNVVLLPSRGSACACAGVGCD